MPARASTLPFVGLRFGLMPAGSLPASQAGVTDLASCEPAGPGARHSPEEPGMGNAGRHQATGRGRWRQVLPRHHRWYGALAMGAGIAALAGAAVVMPTSHSPHPAAT